MTIPEFDSKSLDPKKAAVVSFDVGGFSDFCKHPEAAPTIPKFISATFKILKDTLSSEVRWVQTKWPKLTEPDFTKFTGDGAIMLWLTQRSSDFDAEFCYSLVAHMVSFRQAFNSRVEAWEHQWKTHGLPKNVRIGITLGTVYPLQRPEVLGVHEDPIDYVGYCINLAVRLQDHCPQLGFIVHADLHINVNGFKDLMAVRMKGVGEEPVPVFEKDYECYEASRKKSERRKFKLGC